MDNIKLNLFKGELPLDIKLEELSQPVLDYCLTYGLKQSLADAGAGEKNVENKKAMALKRLDAFKKGIVPKSGGSPQSEHQREFKLFVVEQLIRQGLTAKDAKEKVPAIIGGLTDEQTTAINTQVDIIITARNDRKKNAPIVITL